MKTNDLRIGNWVKVNDPIFGVNTYKVATIRDNGIITLNDNISCLVGNIEPIELTEELLLKIGLEKGDTAPRYQKYYWEVYCENGKSLRLSYDFYYDEQRRLNITFRNREGIENEFKKYDIKYIHELQNTYYCLTGQELEVEL